MVQNNQISPKLLKRQWPMESAWLVFWWVYWAQQIRVLTHELDYNLEDLNWCPQPNERMANRRLGPVINNDGVPLL